MTDQNSDKSNADFYKETVFLPKTEFPMRGGPAKHNRNRIRRLRRLVMQLVDEESRPESTAVSGSASGVPGLDIPGGGIPRWHRASERQPWPS